MAKILVYPGLIFNGIWGHSTELTIGLAKNHQVTYLEVLAVNDPNHPSVCPGNTKHQLVPNLTIFGSSKVCPKWNLSYLIRTQVHTIRSFFRIQDRFDTAFLYNVYDWPFLLLCKLYRKKVIFEYVDEYYKLTSNIIFKTYLKFTTWLFLKLSDKVVCTAKLLEHHAKKKNKQVHYLPNCVNIADKQNMTKKTTDKFIVGFCGGLGKWVSIEIIMQTAKHYENDSQVEFWIIGGGERFDEFKQLIDKHNVSNIKLFGPTPHDEIYKYLSNFDVAIIPFKLNKITHSVSPVKLFEYWLAKKPVIASRTYEMLNFIGYVLYADDYKAMVRQIDYLKDNKFYQGLKLGEAGYKLVKEKYNWDKTIEEYEILLKVVQI